MKAFYLGWVLIPLFFACGHAALPVPKADSKNQADLPEGAEFCMLPEPERFRTLPELRALTGLDQERLYRSMLDLAAPDRSILSEWITLNTWIVKFPALTMDDLQALKNRFCEAPE